MVTRKQISEIILPLLEGSEFELMNVHVQGRSGRLAVSITLDHRTRGIMLDECAEWSRKFENAFDASDDFPRQYALDVSSPGLDLPLEKEWQFSKNIGRKLKIEFRADKPDEKKPKPEKLVLNAVENGNLLFEDHLPVPIDSIDKARIILPW